MRNLFTKWLAALLAALLLLSPVALMEEVEPAAEAPAEVVEAVEPAEPAAEDAGEDAEPAADDELILDAEEEVAEAADADFVDEAEDVEAFVEEEAELETFDAMEAAYEEASQFDSIKDPAFKAFLQCNYENREISTIDSLSFYGSWQRPGSTDSFIPENIKDLSGIEMFTGLHFLDISKTGVTSCDLTGTPLASVIQDNYAEEEGDIYHIYGSSAEGSYCRLDYKKTTEIKPAPLIDTPVVELNATNFPDEKFRKYLKSNQFYHLKSGSDWVYASELAHVQWIQLGHDKNEGSNRIWVPSGVTSVKGIEYFPNLQFLDVHGNKLSELDISKNPKLAHLFCEDTGLTTIDISKCPELVSTVIEKNYHLLNNNTLVEYYEEKSYKDGEGEPDELGEKQTTYNVFYLSCDASLNITGGNAVGPYKAPEAAPVAPVAAPATLNALKKNSKTVVYAPVGTTYQLNLGGKTAKSIKSSRKKVATVANGIVTVKGFGKTTLTIKISKKVTRKLVLTVKNPNIPQSVTLNVASTAVKKGDTVTLTPVIPDGTSSAFKWKSSNKKVATVKNGVVTFKKKGKVTITCTAKRGKKKAKVTFNVSPQ